MMLLGPGYNALGEAMLTLIEREFVVEAGLEDVWNHLARIEQWPTWARHIRRVELHPPGLLTSASAGRIHLRNGIRSTFTVVEFNPRKNWKWVGPFLWLTVHYDHRFIAVEERRTKLIWIVAVEGFAETSVGQVFASIYKRNLAAAIPRLMNELTASTIPKITGTPSVS
jgi:hypothetical protein